MCLMTEYGLRAGRGISRDGRYYVYRNKAGEERYTQVVSRDLDFASIKALNVLYVVRVRPSPKRQKQLDKQGRAWKNAGPAA